MTLKYYVIVTYAIFMQNWLQTLTDCV